MSESKIAVASEQILEFMMIQNRPCGINNIVDSLKADYGRSNVIRGLDLLVSEKKIEEKSYGKQKVYYINQNLFANLQNVDVQAMDAEIKDVVTEIKDMDAEIKELSGTMSVLQKKIKNSGDTLSSLDNSMTTEEAEAELKSLKNEMPALKEELINLQNKSGTFDPEEKKTLYDKKEKYSKEYIRRKRMANIVIDAILEGYPKTKAHLLEEIGVEADGDMPV